MKKFENNKEWADLETWLKAVEADLIKYPSPLIKKKNTLAKRLAQCLNPHFHEVHSQTLKVYELIFKNMMINNDLSSEYYIKFLSEDLSIYSVGLFPFFQNANSKVIFYLC